jgi:hypothetical protein
VAALTMPTLVNSTRKKELEAGLKKHYSAMSQALLQYEYDNGNALSSVDFPTYSFKPIFCNILERSRIAVIKIVPHVTALPVIIRHLTVVLRPMGQIVLTRVNF